MLGLDDSRHQPDTQHLHMPPGGCPGVRQNIHSVLGGTEKIKINNMCFTTVKMCGDILQQYIQLLVHKVCLC